MFYHTPSHVPFVAGMYNILTGVVHVFHVLDDDWLSKQLKNGSSCPRASEAADRGKNHAYLGLQIR